jgi:mRNA interferase MazF
LYWIDWDPARGSEQAGRRPGLIVQSNVPNRIERYPLTIVVALTTSLKGHRSNVRVEPTPGNGLSSPSEVLRNQIQTISKDRLGGFIGRLTSSDMAEVNEKLRYILELAL